MRCPPTIEHALQELEAGGLLRRFHDVHPLHGANVVVDGRPVVNFCSNDYLGLATDTRLRDAATACAELEGWGSGSARLIAGNRQTHRDLEKAIAAFHRAGDALLFSSGYHANTGILPALVGAEDAVYSDELNHASIIDGARLARAKVYVYRHRDAAHLRECMEQSRAHHRQAWIVSDSLFSMDGDVAPLKQLSSLTAEFDAFLYLDEAHAVGVLGPGGRGLASNAGVSPDVLVGTFGKAFGSYGAYCIANPRALRFLRQAARSAVFTTSLPPSLVAASTQAVRLLGEKHGAILRKRVMERAAQLEAGLRALGLPFAEGGTPIFPILIGGATRTMDVSRELLRAGYFVQGIRPPTVAAGASRLRVTVRADHTAQEVEGLLGSLSALNL